MIMLLMLGSTSMASAQNVMGFFINTYDNLCTEAFLRSIDGSHITMMRYLDSISEHKSILIHLPTEKSENVLHALLERPDVFSVQTFSVVGEPPFPDKQYYSPTAHDPPETRSECYPELDTILNNFVRNVLGSPDNNSIPAPYDHANPDDLIGVIINTHEPFRVQEYLGQNGAVPLSTTVSDEYISMEAFVPVSLLIPFIEQHPDVEISAMIIDERAVIHTGDWYYNPDGVSYRGAGDQIFWYVPLGYVGVINMSTDRAAASVELPADIQDRCYYSDGLEQSDRQHCEGNVNAKIAEILTDAHPRAKLYVVETNPPHITSTANWMLDWDVDTIHIITDAGTLTTTMSRAYLVHATDPPPHNHEPVLDIDNAIISKGNKVSHQFFVRDHDLNDRLSFGVVSSNRSVATIEYEYGSAAGKPPSGYSNTVRSGYTNIIPHSTGTAKITISVTDGASVVTDTFVVNVTDNTAPKLRIDRFQFNLVVGAEDVFAPVAIDPDGDTLSYEIQPGGDFPKDSIETVSISISNNTMTLTPIAQGRDDIAITVSDGKGGHDYASFNVCVVVSNVSPQISPMPSYIAVPVDAGTIAVPVLVTDADDDEIFLRSSTGHNHTVADIHYPYLGPYVFQEVYFHLQPCPSFREAYSAPLFITPLAAGNTTVTIRAMDHWGGKDTETFQVIVYDPVKPYQTTGWRYDVPRDMFPYHGWEPWR